MNKLNLVVNIDKGSGFCFGVITAISRAEELLGKHGKLYSLGQIVHNEEEVNRLGNMGLIAIEKDKINNLTNEKILFRAHGEPPEIYRKVAENNNQIIDATCPVVLKLQTRIKMADKAGETILIYGKHKHPEVIGLAGQTRRPVTIFESIEELDIAKLPQKFTLFSQTTSSLEKYYEIKDTFLQQGFEVVFNDTICRQVSNRQENLTKFCKKHDKIIFIAGQNSSNGKVLYMVCKETNPNTYFVSSLSELNPNWFGEGDSVGICGATSTPMWLMTQVQEELLKL